MPKVVVRHVGIKQLHTLVGHILVNGKSGSGKSSTCEFVGVQQVESGKKLVDLYDNGRFENMLYGFPEDDNYLVRRMKILSGGKFKPKAYKNEIIMIAGRELQYNKKLPACVKLMSFNTSDLSVDDLFYMLGESEKLQGWLAGLINQFGEGLTLKDIYDILVKRKYKGEHANITIAPVTKTMIIRNIKRWLSSGMFSDELPKINFKEIMSDTKTITSFSTFLLENEEDEKIAYGIILKKINDLKKKRRISNRVVVFIRELSTFFLKGWDMPRKYILDIQRQGRDRGVDLMTDMQRVLDIKSTNRRQFGMVIQLKSDFADAEKLLEFQGDIPPHYLKKVNKFGVGEAIIVTGSSWEYPVIIPPTPTKHKQPKMDVLKFLIENGTYECRDKTFGFNQKRTGGFVKYSDEQAKKILSSCVVEEELKFEKEKQEKKAKMSVERGEETTEETMSRLFDKKK